MPRDICIFMWRYEIQHPGITLWLLTGNMSKHFSCGYFARFCRENVYLCIHLNVILPCVTLKLLLTKDPKHGHLPHYDWCIFYTCYVTNQDLKLNNLHLSFFLMNDFHKAIVPWIIFWRCSGYIKIIDFSWLSCVYPAGLWTLCEVHVASGNRALQVSPCVPWS